MCSTAQMRSRTIAGGARDSLSRHGSQEPPCSPHRRVRHRNAIGKTRRTLRLCPIECYVLDATTTVDRRSTCIRCGRERSKSCRTERVRRHRCLRSRVLNKRKRTSNHNAHANNMRNAIGGCTCQHQRPRPSTQRRRHSLLSIVLIKSGSQAFAGPRQLLGLSLIHI